jgi:hypothetical protein
MGGQVARMGEMTNVYSILVGKSRPWPRSEDNIRTDMREIF